MGFRFRKSFKIIPGMRLNVGKNGPSVSLGSRVAKATFSRRGTRTTYSIPGTGVSYSKNSKGCLVLIGILTFIFFASAGAVAAIFVR